MLYFNYSRQRPNEVKTSGLGPAYVANIIEKRKFLKPSIYSYPKNGKYGAITDITDPYGWNGSSVADILDNEVYIGNTINRKGTTISYKNKQKIQKPPLKAEKS